MEEKISKKYLLGIFGALIGALIGAIPWVLLYVFADLMYSLLAIIIVVCSFYGYKFTKAKIDKKLPIILSITSFIAITITMFLIIPVCYLANELGQVSWEMIQAIYSSSEFLGSLMTDYLISLLFGAVVIGVIIYNLNKQLKSGVEEKDIKILSREISTEQFSKEDIEKIHLAEDMLQKYWNSGRMPITMNKVLRQCKSPFYFFLDLGEFYQAQQFKFFGFQLDELFQYINLYLKEQYEDELIEDYLRLSKVKPKKWWKTRIDNEKEIKHRLIEKHQLNQEDIFRYGIVEKLKEDYILVIYKNYQVHVEKYHI